MTQNYWNRQLIKEPFHHRKLLTDTWGANWGVTNGVDPIRQILMHRPGQEILILHENAHNLEAGPVLKRHVRGKLPCSNHHAPLPDLHKLQAQHDRLGEMLRKEGIQILYLDESENESKSEHEREEKAKWPEQLFTRDLGMVIPGGVILSRFALHIRYGETAKACRALAGAGMPILGAIQGYGFAEGGSFTMLDDKTAAIGRSERVNLDGIEQIRQILRIQGIDLLAIDLPSSIIHLDEAFLMVDRHTALVNTTLLPFWFLEELHHRDIIMLHVDPDDPPLSINALTLSPGKVMFAESGRRTIKLLEHNNMEVIPVDVSEIFKLGGGIHCVTLPLARSTQPGTPHT